MHARSNIDSAQLRDHTRIAYFLRCAGEVVLDFFAATGAVLEDLRTVLTGLRADLTVRLTVLRAAGAAAVLVLERTRFVVRFLVVAAGVVFFALYAVAFLAFTPGAAAGAGFAVFGDTAAAELLPDRRAAGDVVDVANDGSTDVAESVNASAAENAARAKDAP